MKTLNSLIIIILLLSANEIFGIEFKYDNGSAKGQIYTSQRVGWEESVQIVPSGPCTVSKIKIYYYGTVAGKDTLYICGFPTAGNLYPTEYIWDYNTLIDPVVVNYDGVEGWKEFDITSFGLKSDGIDKIVVQHKLKVNGPWFGYDSDGRQGPLSWYTDPFTPNSNFYNIQGTIHYLPPGDFMVRLELTYLYPEGDGSMPAPQPSLVQLPFNIGGEISVADIDKDGWDDVVLGGSVLKNNYLQDGTFQNISSQTNISAAGTNWADYDNDGDLDCYAFVNGQFDWDKRMVQNNDKIYRNNGNGTFTPVPNDQIFKKPYPNPAEDFKLGTGATNDSYFNPYNTCTPFWVDYNSDGNPDLFIANKRIEISGKSEIYCPDEIWINNGDGTFTNKRTESKITSGEPYTPVDANNSGGYYDCYGAVAADYNNDMKPDIFVANYRLAPDDLYKNNGDGTFTEVGALTGVRGVPTYAEGYFGHGMGSSWGDFNNDGLMDLCVGNLAHTDSRGLFSNPSLIFRNKKSGNDFTFDEVHKEMGLKFHEGNAGACWLDLDNDGYLDLWHGKYSGGMGTFYINQGPPDFKLKDITWGANCFIDSPWEGVRLDFDNDGDEDMIVKNILIRNDLPQKGFWVTLIMEGSPKDGVSNDALGTRVEVHCGNKTFYREIMGTASGTHSNQNSNHLHFGIGNNEIIDSVLIFYPNGKIHKLKILEPNAIYTVKYRTPARMNFLATPPLISPRNYSVKNPVKPTLSWNYLAYADKYQIQIAENNIFGIKVIDEIVNSPKTSFNADLVDGRHYYWRVRAMNDSMTSAWSSVWSFVCGIPSSGDIKLLKPDNNSKDLGNKVTFNWSKISFSNLSFTPYFYYIFQISEDSEFKTITLEEKFIHDSLFTLNEGIKASTKYYWRVAPVVEGNQGNWSTVFNFTTKGLPSKISLIDPANNAVDITSKPKLNWSTSPAADSYWVQVSESQDFSTLKFERKNSANPPLSVLPKLNDLTKYYWRVAGMNTAGEGEWSDVWSFTTEKGSSIDENPLQSIWQISPNPANESLHIFIDCKNSLDCSKAGLFLYDLNGNLLFELTPGAIFNDKINVELLTKNVHTGTYIVKLKIGNIEDTQKVIIVH